MSETFPLRPDDIVVAAKLVLARINRQIKGGKDDVALRAQIAAEAEANRLIADLKLRGLVGPEGQIKELVDAMEAVMRATRNRARYGWGHVPSMRDEQDAVAALSALAVAPQTAALVPANGNSGASPLPARLGQALQSIAAGAA